MLENYEYQMQQTYIYLHVADDPGLSDFSCTMSTKLNGW